MKRFIIFISTFCFFNTNLKSQTPIEVADFTLKVPGLGKEVFYYGFAEGDQLIFNYREVDGKELKEIEITELPSSSKYMDYNTKIIENKIININRTGIYKFRFYNSAIGKRICNIKIHRVPASNKTKNFNSTVYWKDVFDTTYTSEAENYIANRDTSIINVTDRIEKVHSMLNLNGNKTSFNFSLPANTISWSYYIGVDQAGQQAYESAAEALSKAAIPIASRIPGYGPLAALALGNVSYLTKLTSGEDVDFYIVDGNNVNLFLSNNNFSYIQKGKIINAFSQMNSPLTGTYHFCLENDNSARGVTVNVKVTAIVVKAKWGKRENKKMEVYSHQEPYLEFTEETKNEPIREISKEEFEQLVTTEFNNKNYDKCIEYATNSINQNKFPARMYFKIGVCYLIKNRLNIAKDNFKNGINYLKNNNASKNQSSAIINKCLSDIDYSENLYGKLNGTIDIKELLNSFIASYNR